MLKKSFRYIVLSFILLISMSFSVSAAAQKIDINLSTVKSNYCKYEYDGVSIKVFQSNNTGIKVETSGSTNSYDSYNTDFLKNKSLNNSRNCPKLYAYVYTMGAPVGQVNASEKKVLYFYFSPSDIVEVFNSSYESLDTINGSLKRIVTSCVYKAEGAEFTAIYDFESNKFRFPVRGVYKLRKSAKKNWKFNADQGGITCKDDIIIDICADGAYIRTNSDSMSKTCGKSTNPEGYNEITIKEDDTGLEPEIKYLSNICKESRNAVLVIRVIGYILLIAKILVPIALIIFGAMAFTQAIISGKQDDMKKSVTDLMWKFIAAIIIFALPTIINFVIGLVDGATDGVDDYKNCRECIFDPGECKIPVKEGAK